MISFQTLSGAPLGFEPGSPTTWSPVDKSAPITLSNSNLTATSSTSAMQTVRSTTSKSTGKVYWEVTLSTVATNVCLGFCNAAYYLPSAAGPGGDANSVGYYCVSPPQNIYGNGTPFLGAGTPDTSGNIVYFAVDFTAGKVWVSGRVWRNASTPWNAYSTGLENPSTNTGGITFAALGITGTSFYALFNDSTGGAIGVANFGRTSAFNGTIPTGFSSWDDPAPTMTLVTGAPMVIWMD